MAYTTNPESPLLGDENGRNLDAAANGIYQAIFESHEEEEEEEEDDIWSREERTVNKALHWIKRPSMIMVGIYMFSYAVSISSCQPSGNILLFKLTCKTLAKKNGQTVCDPKMVQVFVSKFMVACSIASNIMGLLFSGKLGQLSDQYGRKIFLALVLVVVMTATSIAYYLLSNYDYLKVVAFAFAEGLSSSALVWVLTLRDSYISDVVEPEERVYSLGLGLTALYAGVTIGPMLGSSLIMFGKNREMRRPSAMSLILNGKIDDINKLEFLPYKFSLVVLAFTLLFTIFILPESRPEKLRRKSRQLSITEFEQMDRDSIWMKIRHFTSMFKPLRLLAYPKSIINYRDDIRYKKDKMAVITLIFLYTIYSSFTKVMPSLMLLYALFRFNWDETDIGTLMTTSFFLRGIVLLVVSPVLHHILQKKFKFKVLKNQYDMCDFSLIVFCSIAELIGIFIMGTAKSTRVFLLSTLLTCFGLVLNPVLTSSLIKFYPLSRTGELLGGLLIAQNCFELVLPILLTLIYNFFVYHYGKPQLIFVIWGASFFVILIGAVVLKILMKLTRYTEPTGVSRSASFVSTADIIPGGIDADSPLDESPIEAPSETFRKPSFSDLHRKNSFTTHKRKG